MKMDSGLDTGNILLKRTCEIEEKDTATSLQEKLAKIGAEAISDALNLLEKGKLNSIAQDNELATYAAKITKEEAKINWQLNSKEIERHIRSYNPVPGASSIINGTKVKIWQSSLTEEGAGLPGEVIEVQKKALKIACGKGALQIEILQKPNAKALPVDQFLQGFMIKAGDRFETS